ncbi:MAG: ATP-binding protein [Treponematales bacterium]
MLRNIEIGHFRGLDNVTIPLKRITLLTGSNGVGKTTVLEALHCLFSPGTLDITQFQRYRTALNINMGLPAKGFNLVPPQIVFDYLHYWTEALSQKSDKCAAKAADYTGTYYSWYAQVANIENVPDAQRKIAIEYNLLANPAIPLILYHWEKKVENNKTTQHPSMDAIQGNPNGGLFSAQKFRAFESASVYLNNMNIRFVPDSLDFEKESILVDALKLFDSGIVGVRIGKDAINNNRLVILSRNTSGNDFSRSSGSFGQGVDICSSIVFSIINLLSMKKQKSSPTLLLVDEICAGMHYSVTRKFWEYVVKLLAQYPELQIVATTHSDDCVRGFCEALSADKEALKLGNIVRLHQTAGVSGVKLTEYVDEKLADILPREWEVRG